MSNVGMRNMRWCEFTSRDALNRALTDTIANTLVTAINSKGSASFIISGGNSPKPIFEQLSAMINVAWNKVTITLSDERWVETDSIDSNEYLAKTTLLKNAAVDAHLIGLKTDHDSPEEAMTQCNTNLQNFPLSSDVCLLGMGEDGHTASLFPHADNLAAALMPAPQQRCQAINPQHAPFARMTLTLPTLLQSKQIILLLTGEEKHLVYNRALEKGPVEEFPVRGILHQSQTPVSVYWSP